MENIPKKGFISRPTNLISSLSKLNMKPLWTNLFSIKMHTYVVRFNSEIQYIRLKRTVYFAIEQEIKKIYTRPFYYNYLKYHLYKL